MIKPECLDPRDVLAHLNSLGYQDITPLQLKEFIHDLKKLIKYEQKHALQVCARPCNACVQTQSANLHCSECGCSCTEFDDVSAKLSSNDSYCESSASSCSTSATYSRRNNDSSKPSGRNTADTDLTQKVHTSFIRPWNLQGYRDLSARGKRNPDPVRLYHQYKEFWKSQNIPGERTRNVARKAHDIFAVYSEDLQVKTWLSNNSFCLDQEILPVGTRIALDILFGSFKFIKTYA